MKVIVIVCVCTSPCLRHDRGKGWVEKMAAALLALPPSTAGTSSHLYLFHTFQGCGKLLKPSPSFSTHSSSLSHCLSLRARIEKEYGDNLVRLADKAAGKEELG